MEDTKPEKTSIIITAYDHNELLREITSACMACVFKHTNPDEYELILVDNIDKGQHVRELNDRTQKFRIDKHIINDDNYGCSKGNNQGVEISDPNSKYLCFLQSDVFVDEDWLPRLRWYLESGKWNAVLPHQGPTTRDQYLKWKNMTQEERMQERGTDDGGLILITREAWEKTGGWDERCKYLYHDRGFRLRILGEIKCSAESVITHIGGASAIADPEKLQKMYREEGEISTLIIKECNEKLEKRNNENKSNTI